MGNPLISSRLDQVYNATVVSPLPLAVDDGATTSQIGVELNFLQFTSEEGTVYFNSDVSFGTQSVKGNLVLAADHEIIAFSNVFIRESQDLREYQYRRNCSSTATINNQRLRTNTS